MKNCPLLVILIFSVVLTLTGIITSAVHHAAPQDYSRFQNQEADHLLTEAGSRIKKPTICLQMPLACNPMNLNSFLAITIRLAERSTVPTKHVSHSRFVWYFC